MNETQDAAKWSKWRNRPQRSQYFILCRLGTGECRNPAEVAVNGTPLCVDCGEVEK